MGAVVQFDWGLWSRRYSEFQGVGQDLAAQYFAEATLYHTNAASGPIKDPTQQLMLLNMVTAHIAWLNAPRDPNDTPASAGTPASPIVGRITNASEGSVSVATENDYPPGTAQWWQQSKYGAAYWAATTTFRRMNYRPGPRRAFGPAPWSGSPRRFF